MDANEDASLQSRRDTPQMANTDDLGGDVIAGSPGIDAGADPPPPPAENHVPYVVKIGDGGSFTQLNGNPVVALIETESDVVVYREADSEPPRFVPGDLKVGRLHIEKDWTHNHDFFRWRQTVVNGAVDYKAVSIVFRNQANDDIYQLNFYNCWPSKWTGPLLDASSSAQATEKIELVFDRVDLQPVAAIFAQEAPSSE